QPDRGGSVLRLQVGVALQAIRRVSSVLLANTDTRQPDDTIQLMWMNGSVLLALLTPLRFSLLYNL
ncbi:MAG: hypothetical protein ACRDHW_20265, partial [Ktedonobacteraceae bacterium]